MTTELNKVFILFIFILIKTQCLAQTSNIAPILNATGNQIYCPGTSIKIVTNMSFNDPDDSGIDAVYIQISSGYVSSQDLLTLTGFHPNILSSWNSLTGKLSLTGVMTQPTYIELKSAIEDIEFTNNSTNPSGSRTFSITVGQANYLPSNGHYYQYISNLGVTWTNAKVLAQTSTYYGLQGYLATITSYEEAQLSGEQAAGAGWIGGSDEQSEGNWKWMTGPETGNDFTFTYWNNGEPNNLNDEDYAHVTAPGVGILGSWNDLSNTGSSSGNYQPKGYIVEYGGTTGDPILYISTSTSITIPTITSTTPQSRCGSGSVTLQAISSSGTISWYDNSNGGTLLGSGTSFTTPSITSTTTYYIEACSSGTRTPIIATIYEIPILTISPPNPICSGSNVLISASTTIGTINWYSSATSTNILSTGSTFTSQPLTSNTTFYAESTNNGCVSSRISVTISVNSIPNVTDENINICENASLTLDAGITGMNYLWSTGQTTQSIQYNGQTNYSVVVTNSSNCSKTKNFSVNEYESPEIKEIVINESNVTIITTEIGDFEYSIDGIHYQTSNIFNLSEGGYYTGFVREIHFCGSDFKKFSLIIFPKFFTPNGDNINDIWEIKGLSYYSKAEIKIFDRYGNLLTILNSKKTYWDGSINGKPSLSTDYWFVSKIEDSTPEVRGHFSIIR